MNINLCLPLLSTHQIEYLKEHGIAISPVIMKNRQASKRKLGRYQIMQHENIEYCIEIGADGVLKKKMLTYKQAMTKLINYWFPKSVT